jgi:diguanylate cyclase (GGDEF)-like protein/PAS domain S-box-containing protein
MSTFPFVADREKSERKSLADLVFEDVPMPIMVTDATPVIVRVNGAFTEVTGYEAAEILGRNPRILASGRHGKDFYQRMWEALLTHGAWEGEIWNRRKNGEIYPEVLAISAIRDDHGVVTHYIGIFRDITLRKERERRLQHLSHHDPLTDLPNHVLLLDRLDHAMHRARRLGQQIALLFIDLDNFKTINDTAGHLVGDRALQEVATRLVSVVRDMDTVARVGGDEFAILLSDIVAREQVTFLASRILEALSRPVELSGRPYTFRCSIGISFGPPRDEKPEHLLERADEAMYIAKRAGGGRYAFAA